MAIYWFEDKDSYALVLLQHFTYTIQESRLLRLVNVLELAVSVEERDCWREVNLYRNTLKL